MMLLYEQETGAIINACMAVHNELGNGFLEAVYQDALEIEFQDRNIPFVREAKIPIFYKGRQISKEYYADFICYGKIIVELKCVSRLVNAHKAQVINYLHGTGLQIGLLFNFAEASLKWERVPHFMQKGKHTDLLAPDGARDEFVSRVSGEQIRVSTNNPAQLEGKEHTDLLRPDGLRGSSEPR